MLLLMKVMIEYSIKGLYLSMFKLILSKYLPWWLLSFCLVIVSSLLINFLSIALVSSAPNTELLVSAAASLKDALSDIKPIYTQERTNTEITYNFGSSGSLQQQIEQGAPVDIFVSAAKKQMDALQNKGLIVNNTRKNLLKNQLVLVVPKNNTTIKTFQDLATNKTKTIALGAVGSVPAGQYAQEVLTYFKLLDKVKAKIVYAKDVRQVLNYVATGNADAGFVYLTDAKTTTQVRIVATAPEKSHSPIVYPVAAIKSTKSPQAAKNFVQFLSTEKAKTVFQKYGFTPL